MILLSESGEYQYFAIEVPKTAKHVWISEVLDGDETYYHIMADHETCFIFENEIPEILGVIGSGEEISDGIKELCSQFDGVYEGGYTQADFIVKLLKLKGILVENPIEKPDRDKVFANDGEDEWGDGFMSAEEYNVQFDYWQSYESRLVKAVIIKVKR